MPLYNNIGFILILLFNSSTIKTLYFYYKKWISKLLIYLSKLILNYMAI